MSKKNLSLWMDGFMGEANPTDQAKELPQEQQVEQTQEQAVAKEVQEQQHAVTGEASVQREVPATASTEKIKSKLEAKRRENVGRPKKASQPKAPRSPRKSEPPSLWIRIYSAKCSTFLSWKASS